jgi:sec-independent protein translocase protein TatA
MNAILLFGMPGMGEWVVIGVFVLIFFGAKKIPEFMKGMGKGIKEFKSAMSDVEKEVTETTKEASKKLED